MAAALYDSTRRRVLHFGGELRFFSYGDPITLPTDELWGFTSDEYARWTPLRRGGNPQRLTGMSMILDPEADRLITLGGSARDEEFFDFFGHAWQRRLASDEGWQRYYAQGTLPPARYAHSGVYDPIRGRVIVFGGREGEEPLGDTWWLDLRGRPRWTRLDSTALAPDPRFGHSAVYDPIGDRLLIFGGIGGDDEDSTFGDTWQLALGGQPTWSRLSLPRSPSPRCFASAVYDSRRQRIVLFGGRDENGQPLHDTWFLPLGGTAGWVPDDTAGALPTARWGAAAAYDPDRDRMLVFNGAWDPCRLVFIWQTSALTFHDPVPAPLALDRTSRHPWGVTLEWHAPPAVTFSGTVERRGERSAWVTLGAVAQAASGLVRFRDASASPGVRYAYRVRWSVGPSSSTTEPVWLDVPALRFALERIPNPTSQGLTVAFSLPDAASARMEVLDVAGRRVASRSVGEMGAGDHVVQLAAPGALAPGMYVIRLTRGADTRVARVSIIR
jgi:hypothetical protein